MADRSQEKPSSSDIFCRKNQAFILITISIISAILAPLIAYGYISLDNPWAVSKTHPMFLAGGLTVMASFTFAMGILQALPKCLVFRKNENLAVSVSQVPSSS